MRPCSLMLSTLRIELRVAALSLQWATGSPYTPSRTHVKSCCIQENTIPLNGTAVIEATSSTDNNQFVLRLVTGTLVLVRKSPCLLTICTIFLIPFLKMRSSTLLITQTGEFSWTQRRGTGKRSPPRSSRRPIAAILGVSISMEAYILPKNVQYGKMFRPLVAL